MDDCPVRNVISEAHETGLAQGNVIALSGTFDFAPFDLEEAAEEFPVGFAEVIKRIKTAAGTLTSDFPTL